MFAEATPGGLAVECGILGQQQDESGALHLRLRGSGAAQQSSAGRHLLGGKGRLMRRSGTGHRRPPFSPTTVAQPPHPDK
jgi:hypothetical protein